MRQHNDAVLGKVHVRLQRMSSNFDSRLKTRHAVLREMGFESAMRNGLRHSPWGITRGCYGRGPCCRCLFVNSNENEIWWKNHEGCEKWWLSDLSKMRYIPFGTVMPRWKGLIKGCFSAVLMFLSEKADLNLLFRLIVSLSLILLSLPKKVGENGKKRRALGK